MKCDNCGTDTECYIVPVYYAKILDTKTSYNNEILKLQTTTTTVTRYGGIQKRDYKICDDCAVALQKRSIKMRPLYSFVVLASLGVIVKVLDLMKRITGEDANIILYVLFGIWVAFIASSIIGLFRKRYKKVYKSRLFITATKLMRKEWKAKITDYEFWDMYPSHLAKQ